MQMHRYLLWLGIFLCTTSGIRAQNNYNWAKFSGGSGDNRGAGLVTDAAGNNYVTGYFTNPIVVGNTTLVSRGGQDFFVAKLSPEGNFIWGQSGGGDWTEDGNAVAVDQQGNVYAAGSFYDRITFSGITLNAPNQREMFLVKYSPSGSLLWAKLVPGLLGQAQDLVVDGSGNAYVGGQHGGFNDYKGFLTKFDSNGNLAWLRSYNNAFIRSLALDKAQQILLTGTYSGTTIFEKPVINRGKSDVFVAKIKPDAKPDWVSTFGSPEAEDGKRLVLDGNGNIFIGGITQGSVKSNNQVWESRGRQDVFLARLDSGGQLQWSRSGGSSDNDEFMDLALDSFGNLNLVGRWPGGNIQFGNLALTASGKSNLFYSRFTPNGDAQLLCPAFTSEKAEIRRLVPDQKGNLVLTGLTGGASAFGTISLNAGFHSLYIAKFSPQSWRHCGTGTPKPNADPDPIRETVILSKEMPNIITPNGDGKNDFFLVPLPANKSTPTYVQLKIFNRWGKVVYENLDYKNEWDGAGLSAGTYYYTVEVVQGTGRQSAKGWVELNF